MAWLFPRDQLTHMLQAASDFLELLVDFTQFSFTFFVVAAICLVLGWLTEKE